ncbi:hypothetical protein FACS1894152_7840 [Bacilli bacterium]|nr:hypothetical protein FACS1894152_7840 [Bacilli bacterium]
MEKYPIEKREEVIRGYLTETSTGGLEYIFGIKNTLIGKWIKSCAKNVARLEKFHYYFIIFIIVPEVNR